MSEERYRLVVLGSAKVGKTSLIRRYLYNSFSEKYKETIEDLHSRQFRIQGVPLPLDILDTNFTFPDMRRLAISSASAFLLVFAVDDVQTFKEMSDLWTEICERRDDIRLVPTVVVGNKCDQPTKKIFEATAIAFTSRLNANVRYLEVSAKSSVHVTDVFRTLLELSGFPRCKMNGGALESAPDGDTSSNEYVNDTPLRRYNTIRARTPSREPKRSSQDVTPADSPKQTTPRQTIAAVIQQQSHPMLIVPLDLNGQLRRNLSLRLKSKEREKTPLERRPSDEEAKSLSRSGSLIRRTKHLSLKMRRHGEKGADEQMIDESDCKIS